MNSCRLPFSQPPTISSVRPAVVRSAAQRIDVGRVEEIDAALRGRIEDGVASRLVALKPEGHRAEAEPGNAQACAAEFCVLHDRNKTPIAFISGPAQPWRRGGPPDRSPLPGHYKLRRRIFPSGALPLRGPRAIVHWGQYRCIRTNTTSDPARMQPARKLSLRGPQDQVSAADWISDGRGAGIAGRAHPGEIRHPDKWAGLVRCVKGRL